MNLTKEDKKTRSAELAKEFKSASSVFFASYQGLKFQDMAALRDKLSPAKCRFRVVRNTITNHATQSAGIGALPGSCLAKGPTAIVIQKDGDISEAAKVLVAFGKDYPALKLRACYSSDTWFGNEECKKLASLGSRAELLGRLAGSLYGCVSQAASVLQAPVRDFAYALNAVEAKKKSEAAAA